MKELNIEVSERLLLDENVTPQALKLWIMGCYLVDKLNETPNRKNLLKISKMGATAFRSAASNLEQHGYLKKITIKGENHGFLPSEYIFFTEPHPEIFNDR